MKGIFKGLKVISQIFVVKQQEMEIGHPTDVKHVAHIGWNSPTPTQNDSVSWMDGIRGSSEFSSLGNFAPSAGASWISQDFDQPGDISPSGIGSDDTRQEAAAPSPVVQRPPRKKRRGKKTTTGSPMSSLSLRPKDLFVSASDAETDAVGANGVQTCNDTNRVSDCTDNAADARLPVS